MNITANYHTHTYRCKHAFGEDREYVETAITAGIKTLGFSDHCPWIYPDGYVSGIRMEPHEIDGYFFSLENLRKEYASDIKILIGFESEYIPELIEMQDKLYAQYPLDYMILGQHFMGHEGHSQYSGSPTADENFLKAYVDSIIEGMESGRYLYVAHPDLINFKGATEIYNKHMSRLCIYLKEKNIPIEINMLGAYQNKHYPLPAFLSLACIHKNSCIIGIDAHIPEQLNNDEGNKLCTQIIKKYKFEYIEKLI